MWPSSVNSKPKLSRFTRSSSIGLLVDIWTSSAIIHSSDSKVLCIGTVSKSSRGGKWTEQEELHCLHGSLNMSSEAGMKVCSELL
jgi:hypothetical protein